MQILVLSDNFPPLSNAGAEIIAYYICQEYLRLGHTVNVITTTRELPNGSIEVVNYKGLTLYQIGSNYSENFIAYRSLYNRKVLRSISSILDNKIFDLVHLHNIHFHISYGVIALIKKYRTKCILTAHDAMSVDYGKFIQGIDSHDLSNHPIVKKKINPFVTFWNNKKRYNPFRNFFIRYYFNKLDKIITVSNSQKELLAVNGIKNIKTINNGVPPLNYTPNEKNIKSFKSFYGIKKDEKVLLWAGRLSKYKGSEQIITLLDELIYNKYKVKLVVAGGNIFQKNLLANNIVSTGWLNERKMQLAYEVSDIVLVPSICYDMFPTVVLESMRQGKPVIAGCFGGAKEAVVDKKTGYIVNPFNDKELYKKVCDILDDELLSKEMSKESLKCYENKFTIKRSVSKYLELVKTL
jgi:glycosyltransferase involved in cell wall biosynthesis